MRRQIKRVLSLFIIMCMLIANSSAYSFVYANDLSEQESGARETRPYEEEASEDIVGASSASPEEEEFETEAEEDETEAEEDETEAEVDETEEEVSEDIVGASSASPEEEASEDIVGASSASPEEEEFKTEAEVDETEAEVYETEEEASEDIVGASSASPEEDEFETEAEEDETEFISSIDKPLLGAGVTVKFNMDTNYGGREYVMDSDFEQSATSIRNVNVGETITAPTCTIINSEESSRGLSFAYWLNIGSGAKVNSGAPHTYTNNDTMGNFTGYFNDSRKSLTLKPHSDYSSYIKIPNINYSISIKQKGWVINDIENKATRKSRITQEWLDFITDNLEFSPGYGYDKIVDSSGTEVSPLTWNRNSDVTYYIMAKVVGASVTFDLQGHGSPIDSQTVNIGEKVTKPDDPIDDSFTFAGWYKESTFENEYDFDEEIQAGQTSVTIYAKWEEKYNTINFHMGDGESITVDNPYTRYYTQIFDLPTPTKTGYDFEGWYDNSGLTGTSITSISNNTNDVIDLYPKWIEKSYSINFNLDGGILSGGVSNPTTRNYTESYDLPTPTKTGYTFKNWHSGSISGAIINSIPANTSSDITIYAEWEVNHYTISYIVNGGTYVGSYSPVNDRAYDETINLPSSSEIVKEYFVLIGWYDNDSFQGSPVTTITANSLVGDKTFYAKWEIDPTYAGTQVNLVFDSNGGDGTMADIPYTFYDEAEVPANEFTKAGYTFANWVDQNGVVRDVKSKIRMTGDVTLTAIWTQNVVPGGSGGRSSGGSGGGGGGGGDSDANRGPMGDLTSIIKRAKLVKNKEYYRYVNIGLKQWIKNQDGTYELLLLPQNAKVVGLWIEDVVMNGNVTIAVDVYYFDDSGKMITGMVKDDIGNYYYLETEANENEGKMVIGWKVIEGDYYYFAVDGKMLRNGATPYGYIVDENGKLILR